MNVGTGSRSNVAAQERHIERDGLLLDSNKAKRRQKAVLLRLSIDCEVDQDDKHVNYGLLFGWTPEDPR